MVFSLRFAPKLAASPSSPGANNQAYDFESTILSLYDFRQLLNFSGTELDHVKNEKMDDHY